MDLARKIYLSPAGRIISIMQNYFSFLSRPFMVYGFYDKKNKQFRKHTRISSSAKISYKKNLDIGDHVWISHYTVIDASAGLKIGEGVQLGAWVGVFTHSAHMSIRLMGREYIKVPPSERIGYVTGKVEIGPYTCIGASSIVLPGIQIGRGCIVGANSVIRKDVPDYSIMDGNPLTKIGDTRQIDKGYLNKKTQSSYYDSEQKQPSYSGYSKHHLNRR